MLCSHLNNKHDLIRAVWCGFGCFAIGIRLHRQDVLEDGLLFLVLDPADPAVLGAILKQLLKVKYGENVEQKDNLKMLSNVG